MVPVLKGLVLMAFVTKQLEVMWRLLKRATIVLTKKFHLLKENMSKTTPSIYITINTASNLISLCISFTHTSFSLPYLPLPKEKLVFILDIQGNYIYAFLFLVLANTNALKSGCGVKGRLLNSGWN